MAVRLPALFLNAASLERDPRAEPVSATDANARPPRDRRKPRRPRSGA
jgi:hypothetical protein